MAFFPGMSACIFWLAKLLEMQYLLVAEDLLSNTSGVDKGVFEFSSGQTEDWSVWSVTGQSWLRNMGGWGWCVSPLTLFEILILPYEAEGFTRSSLICPQESFSVVTFMSRSGRRRCVWKVALFLLFVLNQVPFYIKHRTGKMWPLTPEAR